MSNSAYRRVFYGSFFYINICGFISRYTFLYENWVRDNIYLRFTVQHPTSDSTQITAGDPEVSIEGPVPLNAPLAEKYICT